ncbi:uncharacterized protein LOC118485791 [Helianthus annuus]|uniref:uncharacterized protein LOC118485791 n=1 Tax=Helianthus annuus TaxID=4232 RepID=UPI001652E862|nr:uncharacterized protein LOC118485791 [Helianthus annuus]
MPKYAKFLKDFLKRKDRLGECSNTPLNGDCSAVILDKLLEKLTDPGIFTIPCLFGGDVKNHALADLGASINLMPYSFYEKLGLGDLKPTRMTLSLADKTVKYPRGIVENLLVKVDNCQRFHAQRPRSDFKTLTIIETTRRNINDQYKEIDNHIEIE